MRITADCPLLDPKISGKVLEVYKERSVDYASNFLGRRTFPDGLDNEVFGFETLERAWKEARCRSEREHVTPYIWKHPEQFRLGGIEHSEDLSRHRWTVDEPRDLEFIRALWRHLPTQGSLPTLEQVVEVLRRHPELSRVNAGLKVNASYAKSMLEDRVVR